MTGLRPTGALPLPCGMHAGNQVAGSMPTGRFAPSPPGFSYYIIVFVLDMVFGMLAQVVVMWFSRWREFRADGLDV